MKRHFCLKARNGLGRFAPSALPHKVSPSVCGWLEIPGVSQVCVLLVNPFFLPLDIQQTPCRCHFFIVSNRDRRSYLWSQNYFVSHSRVAKYGTRPTTSVGRTCPCYLYCCGGLRYSACASVFLSFPFALGRILFIDTMILLY